MAKYVMALDAGTTSNRCILFNEKGEMCSVAQREFTQYFPKPGWVEHDADEIWASMLGVAVEAMNMIGATAADIAAIAKYGAPLVVLDFGTATTLDAVSREGVYLGGCITAGVQVSIDGLFQKTALLPRVELVKPDTVLSTTAVGQIQAGAVLGYIGAIEYLIRHAKEEIGQPDTKVVATGGLSRLVADNTELIDVVDPQLVLDGLRIIYERARR